MHTTQRGSQPCALSSLLSSTGAAVSLDSDTQEVSQQNKAFHRLKNGSNKQLPCFLVTEGQGVCMYQTLITHSKPSSVDPGWEV